MRARAYVGGQFEFNLDGSPTSAWIQSVEGGGTKTEVITENVSSDEFSFRHTALLEHEPITVKVALAAARPFLKWIDDSWNRRFSRRNGSIVHGDFNLQARFEQSFTNALISKVEFPALDASSNEPAYLTVEIQPEAFRLEPASGPLRGLEQPYGKAKLWTPSMFSMDLHGIDCRHVRKIEALTFTQKIAKLFYGTERAPELEPTGVEYPTLTLTLAAAYARDFLAWHETFVVRGARDIDQLKTGHLAFLEPSGHRRIFTIDLNSVGINKVTIDKSEAGGEELKLVKVELFADDMRFTLEPLEAPGLV